MTKTYDGRAGPRALRVRGRAQTTTDTGSTTAPRTSQRGQGDRRSPGRSEQQRLARQLVQHRDEQHTLPSTDPAANACPEEQEDEEASAGAGRSGRVDMHRARRTTPPTRSRRRDERPARLRPLLRRRGRKRPPRRARRTDSAAAPAPRLPSGNAGQSWRGASAEHPRRRGRAKDPGMSSRPGDVTGQPTDTEKPVTPPPPQPAEGPVAASRAGGPPDVVRERRVRTLRGPPAHRPACKGEGEHV